MLPTPRKQNSYSSLPALRPPSPPSLDDLLQEVVEGTTLLLGEGGQLVVKLRSDPQAEELPFALGWASSLSGLTHDYTSAITIPRVFDNRKHICYQLIK